MIFDKNVGACEYQIVREAGEEIMYINCNQCSHFPSLESDPLCMLRTIDKLAREQGISRIIFNQHKNYIYDYEQTQVLLEIANIYNHLIKQKNILGLSFSGKDAALRRSNIHYIVFNLMRSDPISAYVETLRFLRESKIVYKRISDKNEREDQVLYIHTLEEICKLLEHTKLISLVKDKISGHTMGDRTLYRDIFKAIITPDFMFTRLMSKLPLDGEQLDMYSTGDIDIKIFRLPDQIKNLYHVNPPEFKISEDKQELLNLARTVLSEHKPREEEFLDPDRMRTTFFNIGRDLLIELAETKGYDIPYNEIEELAKILVRHTVGFGLVEVLLEDQKIQDISINGPIGQTPIFVTHQDYDECVTNIIPSHDDAESWATKFRLLSGRPLDEANPVLDTELILPHLRARVAIISSPLSPWGLAYAFRRHRDKPWTLPLFMKNKMISPLAAGLIGFLIDGARTLLIAGTRGSGKSSFLGSCMVDIMRKYKIISCEDSVTGDSEILIKRNGKFEKITMGELVDGQINRYGRWYNLSGHEVLGNYDNVKVYSMNKEGKIKLSKVSKFIRHKVKKPIYEITTRTGRKIKVTGDHSLFGLSSNAKISEIKPKNISEGQFIAVPRVLPNNMKDLKTINLLDYLDKLNKGFFIGKPIKDFLKKHKFEVKQLSKEHKYAGPMVHNWIRSGIVPIKILKDMYCLGFKLNNFKSVYYKHHSNSKSLPVLLDMDENLLTLAGLWIADGCYDHHGVILSVVEEKNREIVRKFVNKYNLGFRMHSDTFSLEICSSVLKEIMREVLELKGSAYTKKIPQWAFNLSKKQISYILKGIFSGDGCVTDKEIVICLSSLGLLRDIQSLLLQFGIILRIGGFREKDKTYNSRISTVRDWKLFRDSIGILPDHKNKRLNLLCDKISTHSSTDVIPLVLEDKKELCSLIKGIKPQDYVYRNNCLGRAKLSTVLQNTKMKDELIKNINTLINSDLLWDQIKEIKKIDFEDYVYDLSVPENENFITENIIAHNTLELPTEALRNLGYNIQPMKVRAALMTGGTEMGAEEGIRTSLRLGDSSLIVGEVRSVEAKSLYEAMRVGALANVVAGTIHGDSPYGVFDRVVNDLQVPRTSFKATDIIIICNPVKSPDGLHRWRRVTQITEVRKHWQEDPLLEKGFVDLMKYNPNTDQLEPTNELINGESEILKNIAGNVKEWAGNWDAIWDNITLRADIKQKLVEYAEKRKMPELLEAPFVIKSNDKFHRISDLVREETGELNSKKILFEWEEWLKREIIKQRMKG